MDWTMPHRYQNPPKQVWAPMSNFEVSAYRPIWLLTSWSIRGIFSAVTTHPLSFLTSESSLLTHSRKSHAESASWLDSEESFVGGGKGSVAVLQTSLYVLKPFPGLIFELQLVVLSQVYIWRLSRLCHLPLERGLWNGDWRLGTERGSGVLLMEIFSCYNRVCKFSMEIFKCFSFVSLLSPWPKPAHAINLSVNNFSTENLLRINLCAAKPTHPSPTPSSISWSP